MRLVARRRRVARRLGGGFSVVARVDHATGEALEDGCGGEAVELGGVLRGVRVRVSVRVRVGVRVRVRVRVGV